MNQSDWKSSLGRTSECLSSADLEQYASRIHTPQEQARLEAHLQQCAFCRTEWAMFSDFVSETVRPEEKADVDWIEAQLSARAQQAQWRQPSPAREPWWRAWFTLPSLRTAALACATLLVAVTAGLYVRSQREPGLVIGSGEGGTLRSHRLELVSPVGDVRTRPVELKWSAVSGARLYRVELSEVDRTVLLREETTGQQLTLRPAVAQQIQPNKTLHWNITALDDAGRVLAQSGESSFRLTASPQ